MSRKINSILDAIIREYPTLSIEDIKNIIIDYVNNNVDEILLDYIKENFEEISTIKKRLLPIGAKGFREEIFRRRRSLIELNNLLSEIFDIYIHDLVNREKSDDANTITKYKADIDAACTFIDETLQHTIIHTNKLEKQEKEIKTDNNKYNINIYTGDTNNINIYTGDTNNMRDMYKENQALSIGPSANIQAHDINFNQIWNKVSDKTDLSEVARELAVLKVKAKDRLTESEHYVLIGEIALAEDSAKKGDGEKTLEHLAKVGKWGLDIAKEIGTKIVAEMIIRAMGLQTTAQN